MAPDLASDVAQRATREGGISCVAQIRRFLWRGVCRLESRHWLCLRLPRDTQTADHNERERDRRVVGLQQGREGETSARTVSVRYVIVAESK